MYYRWVIEINAFCAAILGIVLYSLYKNYDRQTKQRYYMKTIVSGIVSFFCEINWSLIESGILAEPPFANYLTNAIYDISAILMGYYWLCYVELSLESSNMKKKLYWYLARIPVIVIIVCVVLSYFNGFLFYIDENGFYHRGRFVMLHVVLCHFYSIATSLHAFIRSLKCKNYMKVKEYRILSMFLVFPFVIGIIQIIIPDIPTVSVGVTLSFLFVYIDLQNLLISVDTLSGLNNRNQLLRYLGVRMRSEVDNSRLYVFMLDVNKFKKINDTYGHVEGDAALVRCSKALKIANKDTKNFIGRYGGDEFIIIADLENDGEAEAVCQKMRDALAKICIEENVPYDLSFSFGYAAYSKEMKTIQSFIASADKKLYEAKKLRAKG